METRVVREEVRLPNPQELYAFERAARRARSQLMGQMLVGAAQKLCSFFARADVEQPQVVRHA
jgi:hypothetical protein